jgi:hypothetical protein
MKRNNNIELIKRFWECETDRAEEELLLTNGNADDGLNEDDRAYFRYIANARHIEYSRESEIWDSIVARERRRKKRFYLSSGIAASILLIVSLSIMTLTVTQDKNLENQIASNNIKDYYDAFKIDNGYNPTLYINGCKSSSDYHTVIQSINPQCIQHINMTNDVKGAGKHGNKNGIVEVWLKGKSDEIFSVCEGTLYFYQDGEIKSIAIDDECSPNLLVDCFEKPLSEIENLKPQKIKSIKLTTNPRNCNGKMDGEFIVMETK